MAENTLQERACSRAFKLKRLASKLVPTGGRYAGQGLATFHAPSILPSPVASPAFLSMTKVYSGLPS